MNDPTSQELVPNQVLFGEANYQAALDLVISRAEQELLIFDADFSGGGYSSIRRFELLSDFLTKGRNNRLVIVLQDTGYFSRNCPRLFGLLETYGHSMTVYETSDEAKVAKDAFVLADHAFYVRRFHIEQARFKYAFDDAETASMLNLRFNQLLEATSQRITATTLGI